MRATTELPGEPVRLNVVRFGNLPYEEELIRLGPLAARSTGKFGRGPGKNRERYLAYLAGRAAVAGLFEEQNLDAFVRPHPALGFLEVVDLKGRVVPNRFANVSHTSGIAIAASAASPVGVDIEATTRDASRVLQRVASERERREAADFARKSGLPGEVCLWSAKEAAGKAVGLGWKFGLTAFAVNFEGETPYRIHPFTPGPLAVRELAVHLSEFEAHVIAVASERQDLRRAPIYLNPRSRA